MYMYIVKCTCTCACTIHVYVPESMCLDIERSSSERIECKRSSSGGLDLGCYGDENEKNI